MNKDSDMLRLRAYAKINLTLDVGGLRPDGFHEVNMLVQSIGLYDNLVLTKREKGISLTTNLGYLPNDERNLAHQAATLFFSETGIAGGVNIEIRKGIPVAAGLAGGSTDAAAVLKGLNRLYKAGLSRDELMTLGAKLGSDIPCCILGGTCLATGRGEIVRRVEAMPEAFVLLVKPIFSVSTPAAYKAFDSEVIEHHPDNAKMRAAFRENNLEKVGAEMMNLLEPGVFREHPELAEMKAAIKACGAEGAMMSGSGPTVYGLFSTREAAEQAKVALREQFPELAVARVTELYRPGNKVTANSQQLMANS